VAGAGIILDIQRVLSLGNIAGIGVPRQG